MKAPADRMTPATRQQRLGNAPATNLHARDTAAVDNQLLHQRVGAHREVALFANRFDIGARRRPAFALALGDLVEPEALLPRAVEIRVRAQLQGCGGFDEGVGCGVGVFLILDKQRTPVAVVIVAPARVRLGMLEPGEHVVIGPTGAAHGRPVVVIPAVAADIDHRVDRRGASQPPSARLVSSAPVQPFLGNGFVLVVGYFRDEGHEAGRLDPDIVVAPTRSNRHTRRVHQRRDARPRRCPRCRRPMTM